MEVDPHLGITCEKGGKVRHHIHPAEPCRHLPREEGDYPEETGGDRETENGRCVGPDPAGHEPAPSVASGRRRSTPGRPASYRIRVTCSRCHGTKGKEGPS